MKRDNPEVNSILRSHSAHRRRIKCGECASANANHHQKRIKLCLRVPYTTHLAADRNSIFKISESQMIREMYQTDTKLACAEKKVGN